MTSTVQQVGKVNTGLCPHGLPPSACPICSNMGGGGSLRVGERAQKAGEMSYHQCAMIGAMMRARAQRLENQEKFFQLRLEALQNFQASLEKAAQKIITFANSISNIFILKPVAYTMINVIAPIISVRIPNIIGRVLQIVQKFIDIQDKLNAIWGEAKAFVEKKISELVSNLKSKFGNIFKIFKKDKTKDDDTKIDDDKKIFNLKNVIHKIREKWNGSEDNSAGH